MILQISKKNRNKKVEFAVTVNGRLSESMQREKLLNKVVTIH